MPEKPMPETEAQPVRLAPSDYQDMLMNAPIGIFSAAPDGRLVYANTALAQLFGYSSPQELIDSVRDTGKRFYADAESGEEIKRLLAENEEILNHECRFVCRDGSVFWANYSVRTVRDNSGDIAHYQGFLSDITERKQERQSLLRTQFAMDRARDSILWVDDQGDIVYANDSACSSMGYTREELLEMKVFDIDPDFPPDQWEQHKAEVRRQGSMSFESRHRTKDGRFFPVEVSTNHFNFKDSYLACAFDRDITERKRTEAALKKSEARFRRLFQMSPIPLADLSLEGEMIAVNDSFTRKIGYTIEEIPDLDHWWKLICPDPEIRAREKTKWKKAVSKAIADNSPVAPDEYRVTCKDGTVLTMIIDANLIGESVLVSFFDISEIREKETALQERMALLNASFNATTDGILVVNKELKITQANEQFYRMWRIPPELRETDDDDTIREFIQEQLANPVDFQNMAETLFHTRIQDTIELSFKDGRVFECYSAPMVLDGKEIGRVWDFRDITERKRAEKAVKESEARFRTLFKKAPMPMAHISLQGEILGVNDRLTETMGYTSDDAPTLKHARDLCFPDTDLRRKVTSQWRKELETAISGNCVMEPLEYPVHCKDGNQRFMVINTRLIGESIIVSFFDITQRKQAEAERKKLQGQLYQSQKLEAVGVLAGGVAHDFNNMLGSIVGNAELAIEETDPALAVRKNLDSILDAARRSTDLTRQLLAFARKQTIEPVVFVMNHSVEAILKMIRRLIGENIDLAWLPGQAPCTVRMDPSQFDQILVNLCVNARDAIADVGRIAIETDSVSFDETYCKSRAEFIPGDYALLAVSDNGCGMDADTLNQIFDPFFTTKQPGQGTGMGLATVYGIVKQNQGFINAYSEPGKGTTFRIYIPLNHEDAAAATPERPEGLRQSRGENILVVEDDPTLLEMTMMLLQRLGYSTISADTPSEAIRAAEENSSEIHLVITDVVMPEMNGRDLARRIQTVRPKTKILFMSGYTANVIAHQGILDRNINFIQKPFFLKDIAAKLREILD